MLSATLEVHMGGYADVQLVLCEIDGVLTDGSVLLSEDGGESRRFSSRDSEGFARARSAGLEVGIVTRERGAFSAERAKRLGITELHEGIADKGRCIRDLIARRNLAPGQIAYVGSDVSDLDAFAEVGWTVAVANADASVHGAARASTDASGGAGALREVIDRVLRERALLRKVGGSRIATVTAERTYIIAEIGQNHQGDPSTARELIRRAAECGADAVKSQKRHIESLLSPEERARPYDSPHAFGKTYGEHRAKLELSIETHGELRAFAEGLGLDYFCSPWDVVSAAELFDAKMPCQKIPSAALTHHALLKLVRDQGLPVILSTGMSSLDEVDEAVRILDASELYLLQCTSAYPCDFDKLHLRVIPELARRYGKTVGFSGHHRGVAADLAAVALGARVLERHFTLDRTWRGSDHAASLEPPGLTRLVRDVRAVELSLGTQVKRVQDCELAPRAKLRSSALRQVA